MWASPASLSGQKAPVDLEDFHIQEQSPFFTKLPFEIRRQVYFQYWLDYGIVQHIHTFGRGSYLCHYPCLLDADAFKHHCCPTPTPPREPTASEDEDADDPGDVNGAYQEILADPPQTQITPDDDDPSAAAAAATATAAGTGEPGTLTGSAHAPDRWVDSPWCSHRRCFDTFMERYDLFFDMAYSRNRIQGPSPASHATVGLAMPLLVCKRMRVEAGESLYSSVRFRFESVDMVERLVNCIPEDLSRVIQLVDVRESTPVGCNTAPCSYGSWASNPDSQPSLLPGLCQTLQNLLPNVRELCLTLHIAQLNTRDLDQGPRRLPDNDWFKPLWDLADGLSNPRKKLTVKLVTKYDASQGSLGYGSTPAQFANAPFEVALVQKGLHRSGEVCVDFWVRDC